MPARSGACGGMSLPNTMASAIEALGMALPFNLPPAIGKEKQQDAISAVLL